MPIVFGSILFALHCGLSYVEIVVPKILTLVLDSV